ncbi:uncharacterized protein LOC143214557 [Lasioglossum baleicum]|uniref:uncharacterized protein LOC143214557 n=1 Tax=Lasioglossum baleicum TaxID=434251 RepID=UPI003FCDE616
MCSVDGGIDKTMRTFRHHKREKISALTPNKREHPKINKLNSPQTNPKKLLTIFHYYANDAVEFSEGVQRSLSPRLLEHYSRDRSTFESKSESKISLTNLRSVSSTPALPRVSSGARIESKKSFGTAAAPEVKHSFTFVKTDQVLPVVDIGCTYSSYRYKAFETCLRDHYGSRYPPGEVVLNSMQLHLLDSRTSVIEPSMAGLFDFVKESELLLNGPDVSSKLEIEYLNPLDHFVTRQLRRPSTVERFTETSGEQHEQDRAPSFDTRASPDTIKAVITGQEKNARVNRRSAKKIELSRKYDLSSVRRV